MSKPHGLAKEIVCRRADAVAVTIPAPLIIYILSLYYYNLYTRGATTTLTLVRRVWRRICRRRRRRRHCCRRRPLLIVCFVLCLFGFFSSLAPRPVVNNNEKLYKNQRGRKKQQTDVHVSRSTVHLAAILYTLWQYDRLTSIPIGLLLTVYTSSSSSYYTRLCHNSDGYRRHK